MKAYLELMRPPNLPTAVSDILAGSAIAAFFAYEQLLDGELVAQLSWQSLFLLLVSTVCLYGGGVVINDVFDVEIDKIERPERPLPSGRALLHKARAMGLTLLVAGILTSLAVNAICGGVALVIAVLALIYNRYAKHHAFWGALVMGLCRAGNLLLGMSWLQQWHPIYLLIMTTPLAYIASVTYISRYEVRGGNAVQLGKTFPLELWAMLNPLLLSINITNNWQSVLPFVVLLSMLTLPPLIKSQQEPTPENIKKAVKARIIALIVLNAAWAATFGGWWWGVATIALMPISKLLARAFAVT
ncbi:MAG: UbiA-like protein EboC [Cytophagales bacterium]|nr:UbiA-like protein EboC [Bernardetiaceae bacterium]MDW8209694.1 UbiA-like protein EboC [Cytophagales bacterium]